MHPELAIAVGRYFQTGDRDSLDTGLVDADQNGARTGDHAQHFQAQRRDQAALRFHDDGDAADDAVTFRIDRKQAPTCGRLFDWRHVAQEPTKSHQIRARIRAANGKAGLQRRIRRGYRFGSGRTCLAYHHPRMSYRVGQRLVIAWQGVEFGAGFGVNAAKASFRDRRRHPIRFWKDDVESNRHRAKPRNLSDQIGHGRARPRPLPNRLEAFLINIDNYNWPQLLRARTEHLKEIESTDAQLLERPRIRQPQRHQRE